MINIKLLRSNTNRSEQLSNLGMVAVCLISELGLATESGLYYVIIICLHHWEDNELQISFPKTEGSNKFWDT